MLTTLNAKDRILLHVEMFKSDTTIKKTNQGIKQYLKASHELQNKTFTDIQQKTW